MVLIEVIYGLKSPRMIYVPLNLNEGRQMPGLECTEIYASGYKQEPRFILRDNFCSKEHIFG